MKKNIFTYGTLMIDEVVFALTGKKFKKEKVILKNYKRYGIKNRTYPAIIEENNQEVEGFILYDLDEKSLEIIDFFEADEYFRKEILLDNEEVLVYVWKKELENELYGNWNLEKFKEKYLEKYVSKIIPKELENFNNFLKNKLG